MKYEKSPAGCEFQRGLFRCTPEKIRTSNRLIRSQVLYPVELRVHIVFCGFLNFVPLIVPSGWEHRDTWEFRNQ